MFLLRECAKNVFVGVLGVKRKGDLMKMILENLWHGGVCG